ncbi:MAG: hypothetical protein KF906_10290 [Actinobacteria bacterium]|nr:hypothetical protein [Actinomycetota bacterium]
MGTTKPPARAGGFAPSGRPDSIQVNVFSLQEASIDFDFDSSELAGDGLDACFAFLRAVGRALAKPVLLKHEGFDGPPFARYDAELEEVIAEQSCKVNR